jgi:ribosomal protein L11 methylase PrmA
VAEAVETLELLGDALTLSLSQRERGPEEERLRAQLIALIDRDVEVCPHGRPIGIDLAMPDGGASLGLDLLAGPAMGSGRMPWTRAMLEALATYRVSGARVADLGTGTGILGLIALHEGAGRVDAVDLDPLAAAIARRNARRNGLTDRMDVRIGSVDALDEGYDLAMVSLGGLDETLGALPALARQVRPGGRLVAGPAEREVEAERLRRFVVECGLGLLDEVEVEGWFAIVAGVSSRAL